MITGYARVIEQVRAPDGSVHERTVDHPLFDGEDIEIYHWTDGNMECDCNRASVCGRDGDVACNGGEPTYKLNLLRANTREVLYREF